MRFPWAWLLTLALALAGCAGDPRPLALRQGMAVARQVIAKPELKALAGQPPTPEGLVDALFTKAGAGLWPSAPADQAAFQAHTPPGFRPARIAYLRSPDVPWCVVVRVDDQHQIWLDGYGEQLTTPLFREQVADPLKRS